MKTNSYFANLIIYNIINSPNVIFITPYYHFDLIKKDEDDNKFVDCAICANASYVVSEDNHFNVLETITFPKVEVVRLKQFMNIMETF